MLADRDMGSLPPCQEPSQGLCVWVTLTTPERAGKSYDPAFWMGQCWEEAPFTRLKVLPGQVGTEAEPRYRAQSCHFRQVPAPFWASVGYLAPSGHLS